MNRFALAAYYPWPTIPWGMLAVPVIVAAIGGIAVIWLIERRQD